MTIRRSEYVQNTSQSQCIPVRLSQARQIKHAGEVKFKVEMLHTRVSGTPGRVDLEVKATI